MVELYAIALHHPFPTHPPTHPQILPPSLTSCKIIPSTPPPPPPPCSSINTQQSPNKYLLAFLSPISILRSSQRTFPSVTIRQEKKERNKTKRKTEPFKVPDPLLSVTAKQNYRIFLLPVFSSIFFN